MIHLIELDLDKSLENKSLRNVTADCSNALK